MKKSILIVNPGSSSRKYALFSGKTKVSQLHFEYQGEQIICSRTDFTEAENLDPTELETAAVTPVRPLKTKKLSETWTDFSAATSNISEIWEDFFSKHPLDIILIRLVSTGDYFTSDRLVDSRCLRELKKIAPRMPLHIPSVLTAIDESSAEFSGVPIALISDSTFHAGRSDVSTYYSISPTLANKHEIKRYGAHGLSIDSVVYQLKKSCEDLPRRLVVCHLGSGCSVTAVKNGKSFDTSMGYTPLEGVMMATRSGSMDPAAALAVGRALDLDPLALEEYLNKKAGLLGVAGRTSDLRQIIERKDSGDARAKLAYEMFIYRIQGMIGQFAAQMGGIDALALTATISERNAQVRRDILKNLSFLGFDINNRKNLSLTSVTSVANIAEGNSLPIFVVPSDESGTMIRRAAKLL